MAQAFQATKQAGNAAKRKNTGADSDSGNVQISVKALYDRTMRRYPKTMARLAE